MRLRFPRGYGFGIDPAEAGPGAVSAHALLYLMPSRLSHQYAIIRASVGRWAFDDDDLSCYTHETQFFGTHACCFCFLSLYYRTGAAL